MPPSTKSSTRTPTKSTPKSKDTSTVPQDSDDAGTPVDLERIQSLLPLRWNSSAPESRAIKIAYKESNESLWVLYFGIPFLFLFVVAFGTATVSQPSAYGLMLTLICIAWMMAMIMLVYRGRLFSPNDSPNSVWYTRWRTNMLRLNHCPACAYALPDPPPLPESLPVPPPTTPAIPPPSTDHLTRCTECGHQWYVPSPTSPKPNQPPPDHEKAPNPSPPTHP